MAKVRGASILGTVDFISSTFGKEAVGRVREALAPDVRAVLGHDGASRIVTTGWYECSVLIELTRVLDEVCGGGDLALARAAGRYIAFEDVNRFFKWLLKLAGPSTVFSRSASVWKNYHNEGNYVFEGVDGNYASIRIEGWSSADPVMCKRIEGWMERALELTVGRGARSTIREEAHLKRDVTVSPHRFCRYIAEWGPRD